MQTAPGASLSDADPQARPAAAQRRRLGLLWAVAGTIFALDVITKIVVVATLKEGKPVNVIGGLLRLDVTRNPGAAFSIGLSMTFVFSLVAIGVIVSIVRLSRRLYSLSWAIALGMLLGGAFGNLTDRLFRSPAPLRGHVVDFLQLPHWPVFNAADSSIVTAGCLMVLLAIRAVPVEGDHVVTDGAVPTNESAPGTPGRPGTQSS